MRVNFLFFGKFFFKKKKQENHTAAFFKAGFQGISYPFDSTFSQSRVENL